MDPPEKEIPEILEKLEKTLMKRIPLAYERSPDDLFDELSALDLVWSLKERMRHQA
jgi:hypothetical protein